MSKLQEENKKISKLIGITLEPDFTEGVLDNQGQPNIIDYTNKEPHLTSLVER